MSATPAQMNDAYKEGRTAAKEKFASALIPPKFFRHKDLADEFLRGFNDVYLIERNRNK